MVWFESDANGASCAFSSIIKCGGGEGDGGGNEGDGGGDEGGGGNEGGEGGDEGGGGGGGEATIWNCDEPCASMSSSPPPQIPPDWVRRKPASP